MLEERNMERWIHRETKYNGPVFSVVSGEAILDDGQTVPRDVVTHVGSVAIVPVRADCVLLVKQFRISVGREVLEIPAGRIEEGEDPQLSARRELKEELCYEAGQLIQGPSYFSAVGFLDEKVHIFLAFDLAESSINREADEKIEQIEMSLEDVKNGLQVKQFEDSKTIIGLYELMSYISFAAKLHAQEP